MSDHTLGWIGAGRMGGAMATRLITAGNDVTVTNRTRSKAEDLGAKVATYPRDLADRDIVFVMVSANDDLLEVTTGPNGILSNLDTAPKILVDCSTVSTETSAAVRVAAAARGTQFLAAPVSGNPKVVKSGGLTMAVSGTTDAFDIVEPYMNQICKGVTYVGDDEVARLVKICHNLILGVVAQILAETTVLAESGGISRADYLAFINDSVLGSVFSRYKTPAFVNLNYAPTFTSHLLRKDFELGLEAARLRNVPLPLTALTHQIVVSLIGQGFGDQDFAALLEIVARGANLELVADPRFVTDGLGSTEAHVTEA